MTDAATTRGPVGCGGEETSDEWETTFYEFRDPETGERFGVVERRRIVATTPCIGCKLATESPEIARRVVYEVFANGEYEGLDDAGCWCDQQEAAGLTPCREVERWQR